MGYPASQGLYDPANEHDACGVGMVAHIKGAKSHAIVAQALEILDRHLKRLGYRGQASEQGAAGLVIDFRHGSTPLVSVLPHKEKLFVICQLPLV